MDQNEEELRLSPMEEEEELTLSAVEEEEEERLAQTLTLLQTDHSSSEVTKMAQVNDAQMIMVWGLNPSTTDESVKYYFENTRKSGGGPVETVERLKESTALVCFMNTQDAESVLRKTQLKLEGSILHACSLCCGNEHLATSSVPLQALNPVADLASTGFSDNQQEDLGKRTECDKCTEGLNPDSQLNAATFTRKQSIPNLNLCQVKILSNPKVLDKIHRAYPGVRVCVDMTIQTAHVKALENEKQACAYIQSLISTAGEVKLALSPGLSKMHEKEQHMDWIKRTMIDHLDLVCHWELQGQSLIICAQSSSLRLLEHMFRSMFVEINVRLEKWEVSLLNSTWTMFLEVLHKDRPEGPTPVLLLDTETVTIVDIPSSISQTQLVLRQFLDEHRNHVMSSAGISVKKQVSHAPVCRDIPNLKAGQLKVLSSPLTLEKWYKDYPDLEVCVDHEKKVAVIKASEITMKKAFLELMYFVTRVREVKIPLSPALVQMYEKEDTKEWIQRVLVGRKEAGCHWELCDQHVVVSAQSSDLFHLEQTFQSMFKEVTVQLEGWEMRVVNSSVWVSFVDSKQRNRGESPAPILLLDNDKVVIVDLPEKVGPTQLALRQFLDGQNTNITDPPMVERDSSLQVKYFSLRVLENYIPYLKPGQLSILSNPKALDKLHRQYPSLTVCTDIDRQAALVRASENVMQEAFHDVLCYITHIKEVQVLLTPALVQMYEKACNREWVQKCCIDKYDLVCHWDIHGQHLSISAHRVNIQRMEKMFRSLFKEVTVHLDKQEVRTLTPSMCLSFLESHQRSRQDGPTPVLLLPESNCAILVDIPSRVGATQLALKQFLNELIQDDLTSADITCTSPLVPPVIENNISNLSPAQLRVLSCPAAFKKLNTEYPDVQISVNRDMTAIVRAPEDIMQKAFSDVLSSVKDIRELKVPLSPALSQMFEKEDSKEWIQNTLIDKYKLLCHWETCDQHLVISAQSADLFRLEHLFKLVFKEVSVSLKEWKAGTLSHPVWRSYIREQERDRKGSPKPLLLQNDDMVTIVDTTARVKQTQLALIQLLNDLAG
ncbi:uncharacterized protein LOC143300446 [Babylonia areolata]|uniref:uncharacterized protein LOC143300446 n=1 Tax=Babylonia areolata TaxID=304850 RepID=UPI003FD26277